MAFEIRRSLPDWLGLLLAAIIIGLNGTTASAAELELRVGIARDSTLPLAALRNGVLSGLAIDLARLITQALGMELALSLAPQRDLAPALKGGRIDLILTTIPNEELRAQRLMASDPLMKAGQMVVIRQEEIERFSRPMDVLLSEERVGFERGTTAARIVHEHMPKARRIPFAHDYQALDALHQGKIDILVIDALQGWNLIANPEERPLVALLDPLVIERLAWAVRETDLHLLARINDVIARWRSDGTLAAAISTWIPVRLQNLEQRD